VPALYTSVFDVVVVCTSRCRYDPRTRRVVAIQPALNAAAAERAHALTDEYVTLPDGTVLREDDGVTFEY
jgi:hypothetical protein